MAWVSMWPRATSWPPALWTAVANGTVHRFSNTISRPVLPGWRAAAAAAASSSDNSPDDAPASAPSAPTCSGLSSDGRQRVVVVVGALDQDQRVEDPDEAAIDQVEQGRHQATVEVLAGLDEQPIDRPGLLDVAHRLAPDSCPAADGSAARNPRSVLVFSSFGDG